MEMQNSVRINRNHKDSSFRYIFHRKENALMLYNGINDSHYENPDELEIYTMEENQEMTLAEATNLAVDDCIKNGILANILRGHKAEVTDIMLSEYNEALHIATEKEISYQDGYEAGIEDEKQNTAYERQRADEATQRADEATQRADEATQRADEAIQNAAKTLIALYRKMDMDHAVAASELQSGLHIDTSIAKALLDKYWTN